MVKFKNQPPTPEAPQVDPATGIKLLQQQLEKGKALLANRPLTSDPYDAWELLTGNYLEKAFGRNSPNVSRVLDVGKYGFMPEGEVAWENHRADSLKTQLSQIEDLIELLGTENQLRGKGRIALEAEPKGHRIFIVHGHDKLTLEQTARFLEHLDQEVVILHV